MTRKTKKIQIALAGNPNAGKTTLFNQLTGARQHVGNYPGVTVEKKEGTFELAGEEIHIVDLPGTYSLTAYSEEEVVARDFLVTEKPQVVVNITDASNLERNLYLSCQFFELGIPTLIALNMIDVARDRGISINAEKLEKLLGIPVAPIIARSGKGTEKLMTKAVQMAADNHNWQPVKISYGEDLDNLLMELEELICEADFLTTTYPARWTALKYIESDEQIIAKGKEADPGLSDDMEAQVQVVSEHLLKTMDTYPEALIADHRYGFIRSILRQDVVRHTFDRNRLYASDKIDKVVTHRFLGPVIMAMVLFSLYHITFNYSELPVSWLETFFGWLADIAEHTLPNGNLKSLLISGIIDGVGGVLGFVPLILFMFLGISVLEDSGYLARVAFMMDRIFRTFGLHGSSVMAYIVSGGIAGGCAVPGVMATRTLRSPKERMATLLTVPFMNCGAKLPVLALLTGVFFAEQKAYMLFFLTLLAWIVALLVAKLLRSTVLRGEATPFVMELPPYRFPTFTGLAIHTWEKTWRYIKKAGTVILAISIILWAMMTFPGLPVEKTAQFNQQRQTILQEYPAAAIQALEKNSRHPSAEVEKLKKRLSKLDMAQNETTLRHSLAGRIGTALEPVSRLAGFDWRTNIALVGGFAAKEVVISTLGTAYSLGAVDPEASESLADTLANDPHWNPVVALALIVFIMFYAPCFVTVVCIVREAGSWKWGLFAMAFNTSFAFTAATIIYQAGMALGLAG